MSEIDTDPLTVWLLEQSDLSDEEFSLAYAIHKLGSRRRTRGWITCGELARGARLDPQALSAVRASLERRGLLQTRRHARKCGWLRCVLVIQSQHVGVKSFL